MTISNSLFSSASDEWRTPDSLYNYLDHRYGFTLDAAATASNTRCQNFFSETNSALKNDWYGRVWCNPPYSRGVCSEFVGTAVEQVKVKKNAELVWMLLPARTDTKMWQSLIFPRANEIIFLKGRLRFLDENGATKNSAPFPSALILFKQEDHLLKVGTLEAAPSSVGVFVNYLS